MRAAQLAIRLTLYYLAVTALVYTGAQIIPDFESYLPIGGAQALISGGIANNDPFEAIEIGATGVSDLKDSVLWLFIATGGALLTVLPMAWTYMAVRTSDEYDQSIVETVMVIPVAVTAIVLMVSHSIALAFGLAGIVGGVRFRNTLKSSGDALFILVAIGIGLAAGIGALEIALVSTIIYNYALLILWIADFGARRGAHRYMRRAFKKNGESDAVPEYALSETKPGKNGKGKKGKNGRKASEQQPAEPVEPIGLSGA